MLSLSKIDRHKLLKYLQCKFPLSKYTENNYELRQENIYVHVTSPNNDKYLISSEFYNECLNYNKILEREESINNILKDE